MSGQSEPNRYAVQSSDDTRNELERSANIVKLPIKGNRRAFELLSSQPLSLTGLSQPERNLVVVTAVADSLGNEYPVSRIGDAVWTFTSEQKANNRSVGHNRIIWPTDVPHALVEDAKAAIYCAMRRGPFGNPWSSSSALKIGKAMPQMLRYLASIGVTDFSMVRALHVSDYIADLKRKCAPSSIRSKLEVISLVWQFPEDMLHPMSQHPWGGKTLYEVCGINDEVESPVGRTGKTAVIPRSVQRALFAYCEACLAEAEKIIELRDAGKIAPRSYELTQVRDAVLYLTQVTSGMRNSESVGITNDCWRSEVRNGITFHWVRTVEIKTGKGLVEFLVPPEAIQALAILQRYAEPLQERLADEARWLEEQLSGSFSADVILENGMNVAEAVDRLNHVRYIGRHLFLGLDMRRSDHLATGSRVEVMSLGACNDQLKALVRTAGSEWDLSNHQCRRTFAYNVANSRLGRMGLVFLKWQLKHASMSWTQLYASNPYQDHALYAEMEDEQSQARLELMEGWMNSTTPLTGGAGKKILLARATPVRKLKDLLLHTAEVVEIRNTGHAWCLSGTRMCHGQGVYEPANCQSCSQSVIDRHQAETWQMIHLENLRLAAITDCGPAVVQKAQVAIRRSEEVLNDLGVPVPSQSTEPQAHS